MFLQSLRKKFAQPEHGGLVHFSQGRVFGPGVQAMAYASNFSNPHQAIQGPGIFAGPSPSSLPFGPPARSYPQQTVVGLGGNNAGGMFTDSLLIGNDDTVAF